MNEMINRERLAATFTELCEISSPSRKEGRICNHLKKVFADLGADVIYEDNSAPHTGSECGNLIVRFNGTLPEQEGFFLSAHMDTVSPCDDVKVVRENDIFKSQGETILGGDDKSGIAAIVELLTVLREKALPHPMIELLITTCEEIGLVGAKSLEMDKVKSSYGYALDSSGINHVVVGAPASNRIRIEVKGKAAHAGLCPEEGVNALAVAAKALARINFGRLDEESTCNIGLVSGGVATNIIPDSILLHGEVRSHNAEKVANYTRRIFDIFEEEATSWQPASDKVTQRPAIVGEVYSDYPALRLSQEDPVIRRIRRAEAACGKQLAYIVAGGGSDGNIFAGKGLPTAIIATGMDKVHTVDEQLALADLVELTELLLALATTPM